MIDFRTDNLFDARAPQGEYDLLLCRNVLLYFTPERRQSVLRLLARHSHAGSVLLLGAGETVIGHSDDFIPHAEFRGGYGRREDRKSVVQGKSVSVRVDLGGRRIIKKTNNVKYSMHHHYIQHNNTRL